MKTDEEWQHDNQNMLNHGSLNQNIDLIKQIQFDAIKHGMTLAANTITRNLPAVQRDLIIKQIEVARDNMKEVV